MPQENQGGPPGQSRKVVTVLESVEEIRAQHRFASRAMPETPSPARVSPGDPATETQAYRPTARPPMGTLHVLDDGDDSGEVIRVRGASFVIGRVEGQLVIPHDQGISGRHAEIARVAEAVGWSWRLRDLNSTNGTFARVSTLILHDEQEVLIGGRLFRFSLPSLPPDVAAGVAADSSATRKWEALRPGASQDLRSAISAVLVEVMKDGADRRFPLTTGAQWIGRDAKCCPIVVDDPFVDPKHAKIVRDDRGRWVMTNEKSRNGLWARVKEVPLGRGAAFQCGEQRFLFKSL